MPVEGLEELEANNEWTSACLLLKKKCIEAPESKDMLIRLATGCWYMLTEWDCSINSANLDEVFFSDTLIETCTYGMNHFSQAALFNCMLNLLLPVLVAFGIANDPTVHDRLFGNGEQHWYQS